MYVLHEDEYVDFLNFLIKPNKNHSGAEYR